MEVKPITEAEIDIFMCRLQGALYENDKERIKEILQEIRERVKEVENQGKKEEYDSEHFFII